MRISACRDHEIAILRIRSTQKINTILKSVVAALARLWTISANTQTPDLEPAPFRPGRPFGKTAECDRMETDGLEFGLKLNSGRTTKWMVKRENYHELGIGANS